MTQTALPQSLVPLWDSYYRDRSDTALIDAGLWALEKAAITGVLSGLGKSGLRVLELGCGTGYLIESLSCRFPSFTFTGVDFSRVGIDRAEERRIPGAAFTCGDYVTYLTLCEPGQYDVIISGRSLIALTEKAEQDAVLKLIKTLGCVAILSEGIREYADKTTELRGQIGVEPFETIWHSRYLDLGQLDGYTFKDYSSTYWLITRVVYPYFQAPKHNSDLAKWAVSLPQVGDWSAFKLAVWSGRAV